MTFRFYLLTAATLALFAVACTPSRRGTTPPPAGNAALQNGPMLGYVEMREALVWVQTKGGALVEVEYWDAEKPGERFMTAAEQTFNAVGHTAKCVAAGLEPGRSYEYRVRINGEWVTLPYPTTFKTQPLWQWRTDPPAFSLAAGSCAYVNETVYDRPGTPYGSNHQIFTSLHRQRPDLMLWLGDNTYLREVDWYTRSGIVHRYTHTRALPELQPLLASTHHYAIWDDHDFGPDNSDGAWMHKETSWEVFRAFWGNPTFGLAGQKGCATFFQYADVDFFLLDDRYYRSPNNCKTCPRTMLGREQLDWFIAAISASKAPFKIVAIGNQLLTTSVNGESYAHYFPAERDTILARIERENITGVVFLTGDKHFTELSALKNARGNWVYDLTASPLTSGVFADAATKEVNKNRVEGAITTRHNFAMLRFSGPRKERRMAITVYDAEGAEQWTRTIGADGTLK
jgi:alkaline phosphatase D